MQLTVLLYGVRYFFDLTMYNNIIRLEVWRELRGYVCYDSDDARTVKSFILISVWNQLVCMIKNQHYLRHTILYNV